MQDIIKRLTGHQVLVIGDVILDEYLIGRATRISREAPIPVLEHESERLIAGGAANPAVNISHLGGKACQVAMVGLDSYGAQLIQVLNNQGIDTTAVHALPNRTTTVKTRIMAQMGFRFPQQIARIDRVHRQPITSDEQALMIASVREKLPQSEAVLFSDYHAGLLTVELVHQLIESIRAEHPTAILTADAQGELDKYKGLDLVKCNADDAQTYLGGALNTSDDFAEASRHLYEKLALTGAMVITRGADGATVAVDGAVTHIPAPRVIDVYDTVGAGDTAIAVMTLALTAGATYLQAVSLANYASGLVVRKVGNYAPSPQELARAVAMWDKG
jgi:rfaE bifunctional protein kinase chain/domain